MVKEINEISGLPFIASGKMPRLGGGKSFPVFHLRWNDLVEKPVVDGRNFKTGAEFREALSSAEKLWMSAIWAKMREGCEKLEGAGYIVEDPVLMTAVYEYDAFFIYKDKTAK